MGSGVTASPFSTSEFYICKVLRFTQVVKQQENIGPDLRRFGLVNGPGTSAKQI
jgi:hypothetical protein